MSKKKLHICISLIFYSFAFVISINKGFTNPEQSPIQIKADTTQVMELLEVARSYRSSNRDSVLFYIQLALKIKPSDFKKADIAIQNTLGLMSWTSGDYPEAVIHFEKTLEIGKSTNDKQTIAKSYNNLGTVFYRMGLMQKAADNYFEGLKIKEATGAPQRSIAMAYNNIGAVYQEIGDLNLAKDFFLKSTSISEEISDSTVLVMAYHNLAKVYRDEGDMKQAKHYFMNALTIKTIRKDYKGMSTSQNSLAVLYENLNDFDSALYFYDEAIKNASSASSIYEMSEAIINKADILLKKGQSSEAIKTIALVNVDSLNALKLKADVHYTKSQIYEDLNRSDKALLHYKQYVALRDSSVNQENSQYIQKLKWQYESEKKGLQIESEKRKAQFNKLLIYIITSTLLIVIFLIVNRLFAQKKINRISKEKLETEVDYKNRLLASRTVDLNNYGKLLDDISSKIKDTEKSKPAELAQVLKRTIKQKQRDINDWQNVKLHFEEVHPHFFEKISKLDVPLTPNEQKHCAYIRMKIGNKDIARMMNINLSSVHVVHHRLKKKLGLGENDSLPEYVHRIN